MAKVYLETSFISACVSQRTDEGSVWRRRESQTWWTLERKLHELWISAEVLAELSHPSHQHRTPALQMLADVHVIPLTDEIHGFAQLLVREKVMPGPGGQGDAIHVAAATVHGVDVLVTWNQKHIANVGKLRHLQVVCVRAGYLPPMIVTPDQFGSYA
ncbi:MAG: PIN domain-containing protein [Phycisphaeraceae bacterium]|nr:PIN domain-containing protein [Phycisphaeraceae bacterium]